MVLIMEKKPLGIEKGKERGGVSLNKNVANRKVWRPNPNRFFSVKSCTSFLESILLLGKKSLWSDIWYYCAPPKVESNLWLVILNKQPTKYFFHWRGMLEGNNLICLFCKRRLKLWNIFYCIAIWFGSDGFDR